MVTTATGNIAKAASVHSSKIFLPGESVCSLSRIIIDDALLRTPHVTKAYFSIISARPSPQSAYLPAE
jgi:hypothetical protein